MNAKIDSKKETSTCWNTLLTSIKNWQLKDLFYELKHGHPFMLSEEVDIICETRFEEKYKWMNDTQIQKLVKIRVKAMYKKKFPNAKRWQLLRIFNRN